jgi:NADPH-dependent 2,4-dienoyl-CoA reductase/sulfur reductase-like enzyme
MNPPFSRRVFIKLVGAGSATFALSGWANNATPDKAGRVVVIGGGYGGATAAKYIRLWSGQRIEVVLIERDPMFVSCPLSNLVLSGSRSIKSLTLGYQGLQAQGVKVLRQEAGAIDTDKKRVRLNNGEGLSYDRLVVSPGIDFLYELLPGLNNVEAQQSVLHAWKAGAQTMALRKQLEAMPDGGVFVLSIPKAPYRCPPGPYERACQVAHYFKQAKPRSKVLILDANEDILSKKALFLAAWDELYKGFIEYVPSEVAQDVDLKTMTLRTEFDSFRGDVLNVIPPMRAGDIAASAKLITTNDRWCDIDWQTMESTVAPGVHVLGDATTHAPAMPKSASMANNHAKIAASAIVAALLGEAPNPMPIIGNTCYSYLSDREAVHVTSVHRYDATRKTLLPVPGSGGLSAHRSEVEKTYADVWATNIWADTFNETDGHRA